MSSDIKYYGTGRRKSSIARVYLTPGKGGVTVNSKPFREYLCRDTLATIVMQPLLAVEQEKAYDIEINVNGGGLTGQAGAIRLGISRALLTRDARKVERKKPGQPGARKNFQFSKR